MKRTYFFIITLILILSACAPAMDEPVSSDTPSEPQPGDYIPRPSDSALTRGTVFLEGTDLLTMESFPLQFSLSLRGSLPTPCHQLRVAVSAPDPENKILVDVYSVTSPDLICIQVLEEFSVNIPLGSFPTGTYTLWINGEQIAEFQS